MGCCVCVQTGSVGLLETLGEYKRTLEPGLTCICPCTDQVKVINKKVQCLEVRCESKTIDNVFVFVEVSVQYRVTDAQNCFYTLDEPEKQIEAYVFDVIRAEVPKQDLNQVFEKKEQLSEAVKHELSETMSAYGIEICNTPVTNIDPDHKVKHSLNQIVTNKNLKLAMSEKADADAIVVKKLATAHGQKMIITAEADAEAKYQSGMGLSRQRKAIVDGLSESVQLFQEGVPGVDAKTVMDLIMITQYFDMMEKIGCSPSRGTNTLFIPNNVGEVHNLAQQLRGDFSNRMEHAAGAHSANDGFINVTQPTDMRKQVPSAPTMD